jgi:PAS domain S-box-containing protein
MQSTLTSRSVFTALKDRQIAWQEWWLWILAVIVTLALTAGIVFLTFVGNHATEDRQYWYDLKEWVRALAALVLLFDIYTVYQHLQLQRVRRQLAEHSELFQLITENAADMIAVVDGAGRRIYNSPSYQKVLGYSFDELASSSSFNQVHPADRERVLQAAEKARSTGRGERLEYRMRHKDGTWRVLESTASPVKNAGGQIEKLVIVNRDISDRKQAEAMLAHNVLHDGLTDLPNRALFVDRLERALIRARRHSDYKFAVLFIDIDGFKVVNDSLGHAAGDQILTQVAKRLSAGFRESDTIARSIKGAAAAISDDNGVARFAGDEFTVLLEDIANASDAIRVGQRIQAKLSAPFSVGDQEIVIAVSIGAVLSKASYERAEDLLRDSEIAMYRAKAAGKARCEVFDSAMHSSAVRRLKLETELRRALEQHELTVYYQPITSLSSGRIVGFEALSRWNSAEGMIPPSEFIPVADETGLIVAMNRRLYMDACLQLRAWQEAFACDPPLTMSLNIAPKQFAQADLANHIQSIIEEARVQAGSVHFEIMETVAMRDVGHTLSILADLKALGVRLSMDDFGTGYSSLSRLPKFPLDALKIDRAFVSDMTTNKDSYEIVRLVIMLAHSLGLTVVAEGTEHEDQVGQLRQLGCEMAQGYFFSPPVDNLEAWRMLGRQAVASL